MRGATLKIVAITFVMKV